MFQTNPFFAPPADGTSAQTVPGIDSGTAVVALVVAILVILAASRLMVALRDSPRSRQSSRSTTDSTPITRQIFENRRAAQLTDPWQTRAVHDPTSLRDPARQMHAISLVEFETRPLLNRSESKLLPALEKATRSHGHGHRLMAQTSMGEILRPRGYSEDDPAHRDAYFSINAKRLDFAVFNRFGHLVVAIEYQGHAHYHTTSFMRDAVKREVLRKAGVAFLELPAGIEPAAAAALLTAELAASTARHSA